MSKIGLWRGWPALAMAFLLAAPAAAQTATASGKFVVEAPTLTAIGVEWKIAGDDNRNAGVEASYRRKGETAWHKVPAAAAHPSRGGQQRPSPLSRPPKRRHRIPAGGRENPWHYDTGNGFAGSILNLEPDTEYECRFGVLSDPDGVTGENRKRPSPSAPARKPMLPAAGGHVYHVYPPDWTGPQASSRPLSG